MRQYETFELSLKGDRPQGSEAVVDLRAVFTLDGTETSVKGFYAGDETYRIRFYPRKAGEYHWRIESPLALEGAMEGSEACEPAEDAVSEKDTDIWHTNHSRRHGMVRPHGIHLEYEDGTRYSAVGTTVYALVHQERERVDETMRTLGRQPFNKIRFCVFPKHYDFNNNEPELFAFERTNGIFDINRPCYAFWDMLEARIAELREMGIEGDLILFHPYDHWGFARMSKEECLFYLDYLTRRLSAIPNLWWSLANEYDLMERFEPGWWKEFAAFLHENDPYGHMLSNHQCVTMWDFADIHTTHCCIQGDGMTQIPDLQETYGKPVIFDECGYEGNLPYAWGNLSAFELVNRFWTAFTLGGYCTHGETFYNEKEVLWWAKGGNLSGESPARIAFLRTVLEELPGDLTAVKSLWNRDALLLAMEDPEKSAAMPTVVKCIAKMPEAQFADFMAGNREIAGHCGEEAWLYYYGRHCTSWADLDLPKDVTCRIEILDVWEMTRMTVKSGVSGHVRISLPGKEGIAVLAVRES